MAIIDAAVVTKQRIYADSGYVADGYILDENAPVSTTFIGGSNRTGCVLLVSSTSTSITSGQVTVNGAGIVNSQATSVFGSEFLWEPTSLGAVTWGDEAESDVTWSDETAQQPTYTEQSAASPAWETIVDENRPFG